MKEMPLRTNDLVYSPDVISGVKHSIFIWDRNQDYASYDPESLELHKPEFYILFDPDSRGANYVPEGESLKEMKRDRIELKEKLIREIGNDFLKENTPILERERLEGISSFLRGHDIVKGAR